MVLGGVSAENAIFKLAVQILFFVYLALLGYHLYF